MRLWVLPTVAYFVIFCVLTFPLILRFSTHFFCDAGDGLQNIWNMWWVNKAVTELHQSPWHTTWLHYPHGTTLLAHTLNPFNGFVGVVLLRALTLVQAHNTMIVFAFVVGGLTAFRLAWHLKAGWWPSLIGGAIFTFSNYHFAHAEGHMQLVSVEWLPLFVLLWYRMVTEPSVRLGLAAAGALFLVILCDYYYFLYCVLTGAIVLVWQMIRRRKARPVVGREHFVGLAAFTVGVLATSGPIVFGLIGLTARERLLGVHNPRDFAMDLLAPFVYGAHWRFASLTRPVWSTFAGIVHENSVHLGLSVVFLLVYAAVRRRRLRVEGLGLWYLLLAFFMVMSLGPVLRVCGRTVEWLPMPYTLLEWVIPPMSASGVPVRMMVMATLAAGVLGAVAFQDLFARSRAWRVAGCAVVLALVVEYFPQPIPATRIETPAFVEKLRQLPGSDGVMDLSTLVFPGRHLGLYYQTIHGKPVTFGYIARLPESAAVKSNELLMLLARGQLSTLYADFNVRWLVVPPEVASQLANMGVKVVHQDATTTVYDLSTAPSR